jgi:hypothetical protein
MNFGVTVIVRALPICVAGCALAAGSAPSSNSAATAYFVAPNGSDRNAGSLSAPFLTLGKAQSAMQKSSTKSTYVRAGTYDVAEPLALTAADNGETWQYYPPDGVDSAVLDGGNTISGGIIQLRGTSNVTINGLKIEHFVDYGINGVGGSKTPWGTVPVGSGNSILNCDVGFNTNTSWQSGGIVLSMPNSTIANNYVHDLGSQGIVSSAYYADWSIDGTVIKNNVVLNAVLRRTDGGAIYTNMFSGVQTNHVTIANNYVANYGSTVGGGAQPHGIYLDDTTSNATVTGNIVAAATAGVTNGPSAFLIHGGNNNTISGNIVDLGSSGYQGVVTWYYGGDPVDVGMRGNTFTNNIVISSFTGANHAPPFSGTSHAYYESTNDPKGYRYLIGNNAYWNYAAGGSIFSDGNATGDLNPTTQNPQLSDPIYTIAAGSPVFNAPVNFPAIIGGWGPPGFVIPDSGRAPSYSLPRRPP